MSEPQAQEPSNRPEAEQADPDRRVEALADEYLEGLLAGRAPDRQAFLSAHADVADLLEPRLALVELMHRVARAERAGDSNVQPGPAAEEALRVKCPHCGNAIQLVRADPGEVTCGTCGSSFHLDPRATVSYPASGLPRSVGKFQVLEQLGRGTFGTVYKARDPELERLVAVKVPRAGSFATPEEEQRFLREARAAAQLSHPGIVPVLEIAHDGGLPYIVSEYVEGLTLADVLSGRRPGFRESAELVAAAADALDFAHRRHIVHRDVKPSNLLLDAAGRPHITDFGLARRGEGEITVTLDGQVLGTPAYMAPEQAAGDHQRVDAKSDVYSLGVVLYELLTGELPFRGNQRMLLFQVLHDEPRPPRSLNDRVPRDLETICLKAMAKTPGRRYGTARELAEDLTRFLQGEAILARPVTRVERAWRWCRRNPALAGTMAAAFLALTTATVFFGLFAFVQKQQADSEKRHADSEKQHANRLADDAQKLREEQKRTQEALQVANAARHEIQRRLAENYLDRGLALCEYGDIARGVHWLARSLSTSPEDEFAVPRVARANLAHWKRELHGLNSLLEHLVDISAGIWSPDGSMYVLKGNRRVCEAASGKPVGQPLTHRSEVLSVAWSPNGKCVLTGSNDHTARVWEAASGKPIGPPLEHNSGVSSVAWSQDGKYVLTGSADRTAQVWEVASGKPVGRPLEHKSGVLSVAWSPDGKYVLTGSDDRAGQVWDVATGKLVGQPLEHNRGLYSVGWSPDGKNLLTETVSRFGRNSIIGPRGSKTPFGPPRAETASTGRIWEAATGRPVSQPLRHMGKVWSVAWSPDGKYLVTGSRDNTARVWEASTAKPVSAPLEHKAQLYRVTWSPDGKYVFTLSEGAAQVWEAVSGKRVSAPLRWNGEVAWSPDGKYLLIGRQGSDGRTAQVWETASGNSVGKPLEHKGEVWNVAWSPSGKYVLTGSADRTARVWEPFSGKPVGDPLEHDCAVTSVSWSPDDKYVLTAESDHQKQNAARIWKVSSGKPVGQPLKHTNWVRYVAWSPAGRFVLTAANNENTARIWEASTAKPVGQPLEHRGPVSCMGWSPDGTYVLTGSADFTARIWEATSGKPIGQALKHDGVVTSVGWSADGKTILTLSPDGTPRLWPVPAPLKGSADQIATWLCVRTGLELDEGGVIHVLDTDAWGERRRTLEQLGGPPLP